MWLDLVDTPPASRRLQQRERGRPYAVDARHERQLERRGLNGTDEHDAVTFFTGP
jgi:hypothetical protein